MPVQDTVEVKIPPRRDRIPAIRLIPLGPRRHLPGPYFGLLPDNVNVTGAHVVAFLRALKKPLPRFTAVRDKSARHGKARAAKAFLAADRAVAAADFPGYVPGLNPDGGVWGYTEYGRPADFASAGTRGLRERVNAEDRALKRLAYFLYWFSRPTDLPLPL
jgi:hypothetical protein